MSKGADILFRSDRFNLCEEKEHFINPCCFGEDVARWLRERLREAGVEVSDVDQEDWGWYLDATVDGATFLVGVGGNSDDEPSRPNLGEWRVIVDRKRSFADRLLGKNQDLGRLPAMIVEILEREPDIADVRVEGAY